MQVFGQIFATIIYGNKLNTDVSGWGFLIASRQQLLQTVEQFHSDLIIVALGIAQTSTNQGLQF